MAEGKIPRQLSWGNPQLRTMLIDHHQWWHLRKRLSQKHIETEICCSFVKSYPNCNKYATKIYTAPDIMGLHGYGTIDEIPSMSSHNNGGNT